MASRAVKVTIGIVGGFVGLVVIAILALVAWALFRPPLAADYSIAQGEMETIVTLNATPLEAMVASVADAPATGNSPAYQLDNRIQNTIGQIGVLRESTESLQSRGAATRDDEFAKLAANLDDAYADLEQTFSEWQADGYADINAASEVCAADSTGSSCKQAIAELAGANPATEEMVVLLDAVRASPGNPDAIADAGAGFRASVQSRWDKVATGIDEIQRYLDEHLG